MSCETREHPEAVRRRVRCHTDTRVFSAQLVAYGEAISEVLGIFIECRIEVELRSSQSSVEVAAASDQLPENLLTNAWKMIEAFLIWHACCTTHVAYDAICRIGSEELCKVRTKYWRSGRVQGTDARASDLEERALALVEVCKLGDEAIL